MVDGILVTIHWPMFILLNSTNLFSRVRVGRLGMMLVTDGRLQQFKGDGLPDGPKVYFECSSYPGYCQDA
jgi:hypothetical protein